MKPNRVQGKKTSVQKKASLGEFPALGGISSNTSTPVLANPRSQYEEIQEDELIALASIYDKDFRKLESTRGAWNVCLTAVLYNFLKITHFAKKSEPCFEIRIKSLDGVLAVTLFVIMTASYPKSPPLLSLKDDNGLKESTKNKLQKIIQTKPKELAVKEQAMIMEIVNSCLDVLEDAAQIEAAVKKIPSLEMERVAHEFAATKMAQEEKQLDEIQRQLKALEEERIQYSLVQDEITRQKAKAKEKKQKSRPLSLFPVEASSNLNISGQTRHEMFFEQPIRIFDADRNPVLFQVVTNKIFIRQGPSSKCFTVRPLVSRQTDDLPTLVLKQTVLTSEVKNSNLKVELQNLESSLKLLKNLNHRNILEIFGFRVHKTDGESGKQGSDWTVSILTEFAEKGSLRELIDITGSISVEKVRSWTIELLDGLRFIHENGIIHEDIHPGNVLFVRSVNGEVRPKLADAGYQRKLRYIDGRKHDFDKISEIKSSNWLSPEMSATNQPLYSQKTDVWDFGILFLQMIFGLTVIEDYPSPISLVNYHALTISLKEFILKMFMADYKKRPRAVELSPSEFLATDASVYEGTSAVTSRLGHAVSLSNYPRKENFDTMNINSLKRSRYREDFVEVGRLGKGGFGEVVKARKRLDGQVYAIKKIKQSSATSLTEVLKEVRLLSQLSHPSVVRYYNTWTEEVSDESEADENSIEIDLCDVHHLTNDVARTTGSSIEFCDNTGGLDFMSSSKYPHIEFGYDDSTDDEEEEEKEKDSEEYTCSECSSIIAGREQNMNLPLDKARSELQYQRPRKIVLYISMEYCEKQTLRDLIKRELHKDVEETWRLFREILEGLSHIHNLNIVHRDLKPENIFINAASNVKIGDFGLATSGQYTMVDETPNMLLQSTDMTRNIGTAFYVAPEAKSSTGGSYTIKVDMYSLGIIYFEMCFRPLIPGMDRAIVGEGLRNKQPTLPAEFRTSEKQIQSEIIVSLLSHDPENRPSSSELLKCGKLPLQLENEIIQQTFIGLTDLNSPYHEKMMKTLFSLENDRVKDYAWEMDDSFSPSSEFLLLRGVVKQKLVEIFRHHGAVETTRTMLFPQSSHYRSNTVQLIDTNGSILQLPYDLTLPHARIIAKHRLAIERSYAFGWVFREEQAGGHPRAHGEVDFDIISTDTLDFPLKEAEVIKVLDEIAGSFPSLIANKMCLHINHADLLDYVFDFCRIEPDIRHVVANTLSKLNVQTWNWQKIQLELRSPLIGVSAPSIDDLQRFDFRDTPNIAFQRLKNLFEGTDIFEKASSTIAHLRDVIEYTRRFEVKSKIYVTPLGSFNQKFYKSGILFTFLFDRKASDVLAAGGRYDSLIQEYRHKTSGHSVANHAVGFNLAWEKIARRPKHISKSSLKKAQKENHGNWGIKRVQCDVLLASHDSIILRTVGIALLQTLWSNSISAELARDSHSPEDLLLKYRNSEHSWVVTIKQDSVLKVKSMDRKDACDTDIPSAQLLSFLKTEMRERDRRYGTNYREKIQQMSVTGESEHEQDVRVLVAGTKTKKSNRKNIVEQAQACAASLTHEMLGGPIAAIETTDQIMELIRSTRLTEPETWRSALQLVPMAERRYLGEVHDMLLKIKEQNSNTTRNAFVYNFRSGKCIFYDLGM